MGNRIIAIQVHGGVSYDFVDERFCGGSIRGHINDIPAAIHSTPNKCVGGIDREGLWADRASVQTTMAPLGDPRCLGQGPSSKRLVDNGNSYREYHVDLNIYRHGYVNVSGCINFPKHITIDKIHQAVKVTGVTFNPERVLALCANPMAENIPHSPCRTEARSAGVTRGDQVAARELIWSKDLRNATAIGYFRPYCKDNDHDPDLVAPPLRA